MNPRTQSRQIIACLVLLSAFALPHSSFAQSPSRALIPFQGRLTDQDGEPYATGQFTITFNLYSQAIGGTTVWTERHEKVSVINGMINAFLGSVNSIDAVDFANTKYLGIAVDADENAATPEPEMVPRTMIVSAFHAKKAEVATNATQLNGAGWDTVLTEADPNASGAVLKANRIGDGAISDAKLANGAVTADKVANGAVSADKLAAGSVTAAKIADGAITGQQIQDGSVANVDLAAGTASANLADEGLIALSAAPINLRETVSASLQNFAGETGTVYTVPANRYARVTVAWRLPTQGPGWGGNLKVAGRIYSEDNGSASQNTIFDTQEFTLGPGQSIQVTNGRASVVGILLSNGLVP